MFIPFSLLFFYLFHLSDTRVVKKHSSFTILRNMQSQLSCTKWQSMHLSLASGLLHFIHSLLHLYLIHLHSLSLSIYIYITSLHCTSLSFLFNTPLFLLPFLLFSQFSCAALFQEMQVPSFEVQLLNPRTNYSIGTINVSIGSLVPITHTPPPDLTCSLCLADSEPQLPDASDTELKDSYMEGDAESDSFDDTI